MFDAGQQENFADECNKLLAKLYKSNKGDPIKWNSEAIEHLEMAVSHFERDESEYWQALTAYNAKVAEAVAAAQAAAEKAALASVDK